MNETDFSAFCAKKKENDSGFFAPQEPSFPLNCPLDPSLQVIPAWGELKPLKVTDRAPYKPLHEMRRETGLFYILAFSDMSEINFPVNIWAFSLLLRINLGV